MSSSLPSKRTGSFGRASSLSGGKEIKYAKLGGDTPAVHVTTRRTQRGEMQRKASILAGSAEVLKGYIEESNGDVVAGFAAYFSTQAFEDNARALGLDIETFSRGLIARHEFNTKSEAGLDNKDSA
jgi:hypothetical protein